MAADVSLDSFSLSWSFPALTVTSPSVTIPLPAFSLGWEFPGLSLPLALPVFSLSWAFPALTVTVPVKPGDALTGESGQVEWNGFLLGAGTAFTVQQIDGWRSLPQVNDLNVERPTRHGAWAARKLTQQRVVTIKLRLNSATDPTQVDDLLDQLDAATGIPEGEDPLPLVVKGYSEPRLAYGQLIDRDVPMDGDWSVGLPTAALQFVCPDPRRYSLLRHGATIPTDDPTQLANVGNAGAHPLVRIQGPASDPVLTNETLARTLSFDISVPDGSYLEIDTDNGTASLDGVNSMSHLGAGSVPVQDWILAAGSNTITYTTATGGAGGVDVLWRDAWL
ncbi:phage tail family protein [Nonomuraea sp. RK-328]|nr:phage tail family protein [Nonomuraea sp. RK-328]